jgi:hypothetical protein
MKYRNYFNNLHNVLWEDQITIFLSFSQMTSSHAKKKTKTKNNNNNKTQRGCEMNQLEMTIDESLHGKH